MNINNLNELAEGFHLADEIVKQREKDRLSFIEKFPLRELNNLSIDQFVQGTDENSFCYWLEFKKIGFGIGGGNASKFGIYKTKNEDKTVYAIGYGKNKTYLDDQAAEDYFSDLLDKIIKALNFTQRDEIAEIQALEIPIWNMVLQKILSLYYPNKFLTIGSPSVLINCAKELEIQDVEYSSDNSILLNYLCKKAISKHPQFSNWSYEKIGTFIWETFDGEKNKRKRKEPKQYWLYSPGENASLWDEFYLNGIMGLGWDELGDLSNYNSREEIKKALVETYGGTGSKKNDISANDDFLNKIKIGDVIIAKKGRGELLGYGVVSSDYSFDDNRVKYKHIRKVNWKLKGSWKVDFSLVLKTLTDISKYSTEDPNYDTYFERLLGIMGSNDITEKIVHMQFPLNTIFYGPPGTGKTYNTILRAAQIIENRIIDSYDEALDIFNSKLHNQIEFITFHQNYSYEDFIQGLRPETDNKSSLVFDKKDGVFKKIADKALENLKLVQKAPNELASEAMFDKALERFTEKILDSEANFKINETAYIFEIEEDAFRYTGDKWTNHGNGLRMKFNDLKEFYRNNVKSRKDVKTLTTISGLASQHATYFYLVYAGILKLLPQKTEEQQRVNRKNYVIIIDEINRANISRVFGELITLIEPDKRSHGKIPLVTKLPSGDPFIVPSNLYIIGTMNTADKSIALLDIALRRRFEFESMYPKYEIKNQEIYDVDILKKINKQIIESKGHDFQIGHAYFMGTNEDLKQRMNQKVIPLLLEYYMNDEKEVKGILNHAGLVVEENSWPLKISGRND